MGKGLKHIIKFVAKISGALYLRNFFYEKFPKRHAAKLYKSRFGRNIDWQNPTEFNEKLRWMQFYTDTSKWTLLADKYRVREYLEKNGYSELLVKLYGVWDNAEDIDFTKLPESFVIKTNHGSGGVFVVRDKSKVDSNVIRAELNKGISKKFGIETAEPHYFSIRPAIIAEELLEQDGDVSSSLIDYKFYCTDGEPQFCAVMYNRDIEHHQYDVRVYDMKWNEISHFVGDYSHVRKGKTSVPKPKNMDRMIQFCRDMCKEFPFVRMDFYETNGRLYFGEFTFTPAACTGSPLSPEACEKLSQKILL